VIQSPVLPTIGCWPKAGSSSSATGQVSRLPHAIAADASPAPARDSQRMPSSSSA
jgi:hypothetical protein